MTPPCNYSRAKGIFTGKDMERIFVDEDSNDEYCHCRPDLDIIPDRHNEGDIESSDLHMQIECLNLQEPNEATDYEAECFTGKNCRKVTLKRTK